MDLSIPSAAGGYRGRPHRPRYLFHSLIAISIATLTACGPSMDTTPQPVGEAAEKAAQDAGPVTGVRETPSGEACMAGVALDDGSAETGYGFVPSASSGEYVQAFATESFPSRDLSKVCVCWLKTRFEREISFDVVFYAEVGGRPARAPYASVPATASDLPESVDTAGRFSEVNIDGVSLPPGRSFIGVRWDPSQAKYLFICTDTSEETDRTDVFFREDRATRWTQTVDARDPIFGPHRAILLRAESKN